MTTLLDKAIAQVRQLSEADQECAAEMLMEVVHERSSDVRLTDEQVDDVRRIQAGLRDGSIRLATDEEVSEMWRAFER